MFGFLAGESAETVQRKKSYMIEARRKWPFLTNGDCSTIHTETQLCALIKARSGAPEEMVRRDVCSWMEGKQF
jgi:hypothetical protein